MPPLVILGAAEAALTLIEKLAPMIAEAVHKGEITIEAQAALQARVDALRAGGKAFTGPEWEQSSHRPINGPAR